MVICIRVSPLLSIVLVKAKFIDTLCPFSQELLPSSLVLLPVSATIGSCVPTIALTSQQWHRSLHPDSTTAQHTLDGGEHVHSLSEFQGVSIVIIIINLRRE
jgi:hypothetical protein